MRQPVNTQTRPPTSADLRAYCARHDVSASDIAQRRGTSVQAANAALRADLKARHISKALCLELLSVINSILLEREQAACLPS